MPTPSQHFNYGQLEGLWISQGGPARLAPLMAAIAMAESGGSAQARNASGASGLWQILGNPFPGDPFNPETNARMAVAKWKSQGLGAWATYTSGAYKRFFKRGVPPVLPGGSPGRSTLPYVNPFRRVSGLQAERVDMGVDYSGQGPVGAIGAGRITNLYNTGWPGGTFIGERLSQGPLAGHYVYVAEDVTPTVRVGQQVQAGQQIGILHGGLETGFAAPPGIGNALGASQFSGANPTAYGQAYSNLLKDVGAPPGTVAGQVIGKLPSWLQGFAVAGQGIGGGGLLPPNPLGGLGSIGSAIQNIADWLGGLSTAIDWLLNPANWVRIIAGVGGGIMVLSGVVVLSHVGGQVPIPGVGGSVSARPAALPVGILMVGGGGVLLFVAFHNLTGSPANIGELLGSLRDQAQATAAQPHQAVAA